MFVDRFTRTDTFLAVAVTLCVVLQAQLSATDLMFMVMAVRDAAGGSLSMLRVFVDDLIYS